MKIVKTCCCTLAVTICMAAALPSMAANRFWNGRGSDSAWGTKANWNGNTVPGSSDAAMFMADQVGNNVGSMVATIRGAYTINVLHVGNGSSESNPWIFNADQDTSHGLTTKDDVWLGYYTDNCALWIKARRIRDGEGLREDGVRAFFRFLGYTDRAGHGDRGAQLRLRFHSWRQCDGEQRCNAGDGAVWIGHVRQEPHARRRRDRP